MWKTIRIADLGSVITGKTPSSNNLEHFGDDYPFITPTDIGAGRIVHTNRGISQEGYLKFRRQMLPRWSVCFVCIGATIGKICMTTKKSLTNQQINSVVVDTSRHDPFFVYYLLSTYAEEVKGIAGGAATPIVNKTSFENIKIVVPPLTTQRKIAAILSAYDDLIENNLRRIAILEELAQKLYREWFVHFRFPMHEKVRMVESEQGPIPEGWKIHPLGDLLSHHIGGGWGEETTSDEFNVPACVIRGTDIPAVSQGSLGKAPLRFHKESNFRGRKIEPRDIVFEVSGGSKDQPVGRAVLVSAALLRKSVFSVICASFCRLVRAKAEKLLPELLLLHFKRIYENREIMKYQTQSTGIINFKFTVFLDKEHILVPKKELQTLFAEKVLPLYRLVEILGLKNTNLRTTRDLLLPKLISGEIEVSELSAVAEKAAAA